MAARAAPPALLPAPLHTACVARRAARPQLRRIRPPTRAVALQQLPAAGASSTSLDSTLRAGKANASRGDARAAASSELADAPLASPPADAAVGRPFGSTGRLHATAASEEALDALCGRSSTERYIHLPLFRSGEQRWLMTSARTRCTGDGVGGLLMNVAGVTSRARVRHMGARLSSTHTP